MATEVDTTGSINTATLDVIDSKGKKVGSVDLPGEPEVLRDTRHCIVVPIGRIVVELGEQHIQGVLVHGEMGNVTVELAGNALLLAAGRPFHVAEAECANCVDVVRSSDFPVVREIGVHVRRSLGPRDLSQ